MVIIIFWLHTVCYIIDTFMCDGKEEEEAEWILIKGFFFLLFLI